VALSLVLVRCDYFVGLQLQDTICVFDVYHTSGRGCFFSRMNVLDSTTESVR
jgi:hypothetical protein